MKNEQERLFHWSEESIKWYKIAAEQQEYHQNLARIILSKLPQEPSICDMGCGVGYLSLALASRAKAIMSVDLNQTAIQVLKDNILKNELTNVSTLVGDFELISRPKQPFDAIVMCLFGDLTEFMNKAREWTDNKIIYIMSTNSRRIFTATKESTQGNTEEEIADFLNKNNYTFEVEQISLPFGQPLKSIEEGIKFIRHYDSKSTDEEIKKLLKSKLISSSSYQYPYYFPNEKKLAMFVIDPSK
ncbi:methyltransferase domain-containing protein [Lachnotalea glycerini]|nr:methyltransferase domain-containing protein [Lachnotalea glycerini]